MSRVCRWVGGFAGEWKGLPVSWRVCRWVEGFAGEFKEPSERGATEKVATVDARLKGFARELKGLPMRWRVCRPDAHSPPQKKLVFHDLPESGLPWLPPDPHSRYFPTEWIFSYGFVIFEGPQQVLNNKYIIFQSCKINLPESGFPCPRFRIWFSITSPNLESGFPWPPGMLFSMPSPNLVFNDLPESCFSCPPRIWFSVAPNLVCHALWRGRGPQIISHEMLAGVTSFVTRFHLPLPPLSYYFCFHYMMYTWFLYV